LPIVYSALLADDQVVRGAGVGLWVACARVAETLPDDLSDLAPLLLADSYVVVHRRMLEHLTSLRLPAHLAPTLLPIAGSWMVTYKDSEPDVVEHAIWTIRALAAKLEDAAHAALWYGVALAHVECCRPYHRERLLTAWWPDEIHASGTWVTAALATAASPDLIDYYNQRSEPLLAALMDRPGLLTQVPLTQIQPLSEIHGAHPTWRAMEPVELLQAAGRWADAAEVVRRVEERQPSGNEGEPVTRLGRDVLTVPRYVFTLADGDADDKGVTLVGEDQIRCAVDQPIRDPAIDCPILVRLIGDGHDEVVEVAGCSHLRLRPFDPSRDFVTQHEQTDERLLTMFERLDSSEFTIEDVRAFCRLFAACVRAAQRIMFTKTFMRGTSVSETMFHNEMERLLRDDPDLEGRLTRRDAVAGGFDDLLHDDVIAELKVSKGSPVTVEGSATYLGQPTQYGVGRGSQLSVLVILDHGRKTSPPGVIENYIGWLRPKLHGRDDPRYPSLVGVLIINTNLPVPSAWSRRRIEFEPDTPPDDPET
jgi:hypothetical protein